MRKYLFTLMSFLMTLTTATAQEWLTDLNKAKTIAQANDKTIILVFQGSDWCAPCIKLDKQVWSTAEFKEFAKKHYVMLQADFPRKRKNALPEKQTKANAQLAEKYNKNGVFPLVVVLDKNGKVLGQTGYKKSTAEAYIKEINSFM